MKAQEVTSHLTSCPCSRRVSTMEVLVEVSNTEPEQSTCACNKHPFFEFISGQEAPV